jgi:hypothetical protein
LQVERAKLDGDRASWLKLAAQWQRMRRKRIPLANKHSNLEQKSGPEKGTIRFVANFDRKFPAHCSGNDGWRASRCQQGLA